MECISISHKTAQAADRQKCYISKEKTADFLEKIRKLDRVDQCVLLSTCNRTEIYVQGKESCFGGLEKLLAKNAGSGTEWLRGIVRRYQGRKAVHHLFRVTCGMESMVIGEDEILGQVRDAYICAQEAGATGYELNCIFQAALTCAKRVKTETVISKTSVSVATLAVREVFRLPIPHKTVLLMGSSGQMGGIILKDLVSRKDIHVIATSRTHNGFCQSGSAQVENVDYRERYDYLDKADAIISATSSPHYTLTAEQVRNALKNEKERLFIDISMPSDIDEDIAHIAGCRLVALDDIKKLAEENNRLKEQALMDAEEILDEELEKICKVLAFHRFTEENAGWKETYAEYTAERIVYLLRDRLGSEAFEEVLRALGIAE